MILNKEQQIELATVCANAFKVSKAYDDKILKELDKMVTEQQNVVDSFIRDGLKTFALKNGFTPGEYYELLLAFEDLFTRFADCAAARMGESQQ